MKPETRSDKIERLQNERYELQYVAKIVEQSEIAPELKKTLGEELRAQISLKTIMVNRLMTEL